MTPQEVIQELKQFEIYGRPFDNSLESSQASQRKLEALHTAIDLLERISCEDTISRAEAILQIQRHGVGCLDPDEFSSEQSERFVINLLEKLPTVYPKPKAGRWIIHQSSFDLADIECSCCHMQGTVLNDYVDELKFCQGCGAEMSIRVEKELGVV